MVTLPISALMALQSQQSRPTTDNFTPASSVFECMTYLPNKTCCGPSPNLGKWKPPVCFCRQVTGQAAVELIVHCEGHTDVGRGTYA